MMDAETKQRALARFLSTLRTNWAMSGFTGADERLSWQQAGAGLAQIVGRGASRHCLDFARARATVAHRAIT